jgi:hypothetical protein
MSEREVKTRLEASAGCPTCGSDVELWSETEAWTQTESGEWKHSEFGAATGICCGNLIVDSFDGCSVYRLSDKERSDDEDWRGGEMDDDYYYGDYE